MQILMYEGIVLTLLYIHVYAIQKRRSSVRRHRVKSGNLGHQVKFGHTFANSGNLDETAPYEPSQ